MILGCLHLDIVPLPPESDRRRKTANTAPRDQHPQRICRRSHRRKDEPEPETRDVSEMRYVERAALVFFPSAVTLVVAFWGRNGGSPSVPCAARKAYNIDHAVERTTHLSTLHARLDSTPPPP